MTSSSQIDDSQTEDFEDPDALSPTEPEDPHFAARVTLGTVLGVFSCLFLAAIVLLMIWLPNLAGGGLADNSNGNGRGQREGDGTSSQSGEEGDDEMTVFDKESRGSGVSNEKATQIASGGTENADNVPSDPASSKPAETAVKSEPDQPPKQKYLIAPIESPQLAAEVESGNAEAQAPGMFEGRGAEQRAKLAESEGGSRASEKAVEDGLSWMAKHQEKNGSWSLLTFSQTSGCNGKCRHPGMSSDAAGTGFGLLPFLGAGYTHKQGKYKDTVQKGLEWLIDDQTKEGTFQHCQGGTMYAHGVATIALCEAYAMTKDPKLKAPAQKAIDYIVDAQHTGGGWRYSPGEPGDTSVSGWQVIALRSAQQGGLKVPNLVFRKLTAYLDSVQIDKQGSGYRYMPGGRITDAMIAEGLLCRIYSSEKLNRRALSAGVEYLEEHLPGVGSEIYYCYYATQVMHHYGGEPWDQWNHVMRDLLIESQSTEGHEKGSWGPFAGHDVSGGRVYATSLALLTLEVYYRHKRAFD